jgi:predicted transcriptional regulator of viral defense system
MVPKRSPRLPKDSLAHFTEDLQGHGRYTFTKKEALEKLGISDNAFRRAVFRLTHKKRLMRAANQFYIIIPFEYRLSEGLPPTSYIDSLMKFREQPYYVGVLSAAALHGAAHQTPQELQVITSDPLPLLKLGRGRIRFLVKRRIQEAPLQGMKTPTGLIQVSTPEVTAFDLLMYPKAAGHLNNIATVLSELAEKIDPEKLKDAAQLGFDLSLVQRLGYLLDQFTEQKPTEALHRWLTQQKTEYVLLRPSQKDCLKNRNKKWHVIVNEEVEPDV